MRRRLLLPIVMILLLTASLTANAEDNRTYISDTAINACVQYGEQYGICPELLMAIIEAESSGNPKAQNDGCMGLMQISERWHRDRMERLGVKDIFDEKGNILVGVDYLAELRDRYSDLAMVLMTYNGDSLADEFYETGEISEYALQIMERSAELEQIHEEQKGE